MTDKELIDAYKNGDPDALGELFGKYRSFIYNCCLRILRNPENAEDVSQNVWIHLTSYLHQFNENCSFRTIAYRIARDRSIDYIRQLETKEECCLRSDELAELKLYAENAPDFDLMINDMLQNLDLDERALVIAIVLEGHTAEEDDLAGKLGLARSTVNRRFDKALEKLRGEQL